MDFEFDGAARGWFTRWAGLLGRAAASVVNPQHGHTKLSTHFPKLAHLFIGFLGVIYPWVPMPQRIGNDQLGAVNGFTPLLDDVFEVVFDAEFFGTVALVPPQEVVAWFDAQVRVNILFERVALCLGVFKVYVEDGGLVGALTEEKDAVSHRNTQLISKRRLPDSTLSNDETCLLQTQHALDDIFAA